jgi:serine/threonine protein kinase
MEDESGRPKADTLPRCPECGSEVGADVRFCPYDGTPLLSAGGFADPLVGTTVNGRYEVTSRLASGGSATVYLAHNLTLDERVVLKVLYIEEERTAARVAREARATARVSHPHIVSLQDFGYDPRGFLYLAMEHVTGVPLDVVIAQQAPLELARAARITLQIASGIAHAHAQGIVHRDLKPGNVMITRRGWKTDFVVILDFGIARAFVPDTDVPALTPPGDIFGTPPYMAPEQWRGQPVDARTDIYALGVLFFQLLTGELPFTGTLGQLMQHHLETPAPFPSTRRPKASIPRAVDRLVGRALAKDADERLSSMQDFARAVGEALGGPVSGSDGLSSMTSLATTELMHAPSDAYQLAHELLQLHARRRAASELLLQVEARRHDPNDGTGPGDLASLGHRLFELEDELQEEARALLAADTERARHTAALASEGAALRGALVDAGVTETVEHTAWRELGRILSQPPIGRQEAERRLAASHRARARRADEAQRNERDRLARLGELERAMTPLADRLRRAFSNAAAALPEAREALVEFNRADGAIASYRSALDAAELVQK